MFEQVKKERLIKIVFPGSGGVLVNDPPPPTKTNKNYKWNPNQITIRLGFANLDRGQMEIETNLTRRQELTIATNDATRCVKAACWRRSCLFVSKQNRVKLG